MLQRRTQDPTCAKCLFERPIRTSQLIAAAERGETIVITKNGKPVAKISPQTRNRASDPQWRSAFAALKKSLRTKRRTGYRAESITEDSKYGDDVA